MPLRSSLACCLAGVLLSSCAPWQPLPDQRSDAGYGDTLRALLASQVQASDPARRGQAVTGIDGQAARAAIERYEHSFREPAQDPGALVGGGGK